MAKHLACFFLMLGSLSVMSQEKKIAQPDLPGDLMLDIGMNYWIGDRDTTNAWPSRSIGIYYTQRIKISEKFSFYPAVGLGIERYALQKNYHLANNDGAVEVDTLFAVINRNKLVVTYLDIPLEVRFHPGGTEEGEGFFIGAGVIGGVRLEAHTKVNYEQKGKRRTEKLRDNFGLEDLRYGVQFRVGWKGAHLFFKKYFNDTFRRDQALVDPQLNPTGDFFNPTTTTIGINFTGF